MLAAFGLLLNEVVIGIDLRLAAQVKPGGSNAVLPPTTVHNTVVFSTPLLYSTQAPRESTQLELRLAGHFTLL